MDRRRTQWLLICTLVVSAVSTGAARATWSRMLPRHGETWIPSATTVLNRSGHAVMAFVSAGGVDWTLGAIAPEERRTFDLPSRVRALGTYRLTADPLGPGETPVSVQAQRFCSGGPDFVVAHHAIVASPEVAVRVEWNLNEAPRCAPAPLARYSHDRWSGRPRKAR